MGRTWSWTNTGLMKESQLELRFERECRTPYSEVYTIFDEDQALGRFDVHFIGPIVHATLCVSERFSQDGILDLIDDLDAQLLDSAGLSRDDLIIHVHQGREIGVFSNREYSGDEGIPRGDN